MWTQLWLTISRYDLQFCRYETVIVSRNVQRIGNRKRRVTVGGDRRPIEIGINDIGVNSMIAAVNRTPWCKDRKKRTVINRLTPKENVRFFYVPRFLIINRIPRVVITSKLRR